MGAATIPPVGAYVSAFSTVNERWSRSRHSCGSGTLQRAFHSRQKLSVSASATSASMRAGSGSCDGYHVSAKGTRSPSSIVNSETVRMFSPRVCAGVRKQSASGPATACRVSSTRRTHGTMWP